MADQGDPTATVRHRSGVARILAPAALAAALVAVFLIVSGSLGEDEEAPEGRDGGARAERAGGGGSGSGSEKPEAEKTGEEEIPETYEVQSGDSFSTIADEFGISIRKLERLNPDVDSTALATGQVLKLR